MLFRFAELASRDTTDYAACKMQTVALMLVNPNVLDHFTAPIYIPWSARTHPEYLVNSMAPIVKLAIFGGVYFR